MKKNGLSGKKKIIVILVAVAVILALLALIIHHATKLTNDSYENCAMGDVDGDGYISSSDALLVIKSMSEKDLLFDNQKLHADVNHDGKVSSADALILLRYSIGEISSLSEGNSLSNNKDEFTDGRSARFTNDNSLTTVQILNEWDNGDGTHSYQFGITVKNTSSEGIGFWNTDILLSGPAKISKSWDCNCRINSDEISVNGEAVSTESAAVCGFIVTAPEGLTIKEVKSETK